MSVKNAFYAQSGGVTSVINASACGVIETARKHSDKIGTVYAGRNGIIGALTEDLIDTSKESDEDIAALKHTPSGGFGSCRFKLKGLEESKREYERLIEVFKAHNIGYFFYNGGGDSADMGEELDTVVSIEVPKDVILDRLTTRRTCTGCGEIYNVKSNPTKVEGVCDKCGGDVVQRDDETEEAISNRLDVYNEQTAPLAGFYENEGMLLKVDATSSDAVIDAIKAKIGI